MTGKTFTDTEKNKKKKKTKNKKTTKLKTDSDWVCHSGNPVISGDDMRNTLQPLTSIFIVIYWLPVEVQILFKIILLVWKSLYGCAPYYIRLLVNVRVPARNLHSSGRSLSWNHLLAQELFFMVNALLLTLCRNAGTPFLRT